MSDALISTGITVTFSTLSAELLDVTIPEAEAEQIDVTHQLSASDWKEYLSGLKDGGEVTLSLHFGGTVPALGTQSVLTVAFPGPHTFTATANLAKGGGANAPLGEKITANVTLKISGEPVWS